MQTETRKRDPSGIFREDNAAKTRNPIGRAMNKEAMQMFTTPAERIPKDFVEFGDTGCADHEQSPPYQRTDAAEHYAKLINRNGPYRRFRHANSLSKRKPTVLNLMTPRNLPLSDFRNERRDVVYRRLIDVGILGRRNERCSGPSFSRERGNCVDQFLW